MTDRKDSNSSESSKEIELADMDKSVEEIIKDFSNIEKEEEKVIEISEENQVVKQEEYYDPLDEVLDHVKKKFLRKVYAIFIFQLLFMIFLFLIVRHFPDYKNFVFDYGIFYIIAIIGSFIILCITHFKENIARKHPYDKILLILFTLFSAHLTSLLGAVENSQIALASLSSMLFYFFNIFCFTFPRNFNVSPSTQVMYFTITCMIVFSCFNALQNGGIFLYAFLSIVGVMFSILLFTSLTYITLSEFTEKDSFVAFTLSIYTNFFWVIYQTIAMGEEFCSEKLICCKKKS